MTAPMSRPPFDDRRPGTFSPTNQRGCVSSSSRATSHQSPERAPSKPARRPARDKSWQGHPAVMIPRSGTNPTALRSWPVTFVTSSNWVACGKWRALMAAAAGSISTVATVWAPARSNASGNPPMPSNSDTSVNGPIRRFAVSALSVLGRGVFCPVGRDWAGTKTAPVRFDATSRCAEHGRTGFRRWFCSRTVPRCQRRNTSSGS